MVDWTDERIKDIEGRDVKADKRPEVIYSHTWGAHRQCLDDRSTLLAELKRLREEARCNQALADDLMVASNNHAAELFDKDKELRVLRRALDLLFDRACQVEDVPNAVSEVSYYVKEARSEVE